MLRFILLFSLAQMILAADITDVEQRQLLEDLASNERLVFMSACKSIQKYEGVRARKLIEKLLSHERGLVRKSAVDAMSRQTYPNFDKYLDHLFKRDDALLRASILQLYCERNPDRILSIVQICLRRKSAEALRIAAAKVCAMCVQQELSDRDLKKRNEIFGTLLLDESPHVQVAMLESLKEIPYMDAPLIRALQQVVFKTQYEETAIVIGSLLADHMNIDAVEKFRKQLKGAREQACVNGLLAGLQMNIGGFSKDLLGFARNKDPHVRAVVYEAFGDYDLAADGLTEKDLEKTSDKVRKYLLASLKDKSDMVRICAAISLARQSCVEMVPQLVKDLKKEESGVYQFILQQITGQQLEGDKAWRRWLAGQDTIRLTAFTEEAQDEHYFYGIKDEAEHVVYVIDRSGSMREDGRLYQVKCELFKSVMHLPRDGRFNVVTFGNTADVWQASSLRASWRNRMRWYDFGRGVPADGGTNIMDAMKLALHIPEAESIYFLTDGMPTVGVTDPNVIVDQVHEINFDKLTFSRIHTLSFNLPQARDFLTAMSRQNRGTYKLVGAN